MILFRIGVVLAIFLFAAITAAANDGELAALQATFKRAVSSLNSGNLDGFLDTVPRRGAVVLLVRSDFRQTRARGLCTRLEALLRHDHCREVRDPERAVPDHRHHGDRLRGIRALGELQQPGPAGPARRPLHDDLYEGRRCVADHHAAQHPGRGGSAAGPRAAGRRARGITGTA